MVSAIDIQKNAEKIDSTVKTERRRLLDFIRKRVRSEEDAEDILQDVFVQLASNYSVTEPIEQLTSWLFTVARNKIIDLYRKRKPESLPVERTEDDEHPVLADLLMDPRQDPDTVYERSLLWSEFADALEDLPDNQREVFVMHEFEGRSFKEIAELTGEPVNTLLSRKRYAVLYLREQLQELYDELFNQRRVP
ncbi:MAG TPA: RNA polymerase sigma factor [Bacteroidota bacterium]